MQRIAIFLGVVCLLGAQIVFAASPKTMRVDFYHTGNSEIEVFSLDRVVLEPLRFPGNLQQAIDKTLRGKYSFEIVDPESGDIAWSRSFSSIYGEWETTAEARRMNRTFHESLRFPVQEKEFEVVLKKRGEQNLFTEIWRMWIDPDDYLVHQESAAYAEHVVAIENNGDPATKVDLLLLGDGYTADEQDTFLQKARELTEQLFATSPFMERRSDFNVWALAPPADRSGISRPSTRFYRDSPVGATYDAFRSERYLLTNDNKACAVLRPRYPTISWRSSPIATSTAVAASMVCSAQQPPTATGPPTCSSTNSPIILPGWQMSTTPVPSPMRPRQRSSSPMNQTSPPFSTRRI